MTDWSKPDPRMEATFETGLHEVRKVDLVCAQQKNSKVLRLGAQLTT